MDKQDKKLELLKNQTKLLLGSFDAVQIVTSRYDKDSGFTETYSWGEGNFHTRVGMLSAWVKEHTLIGLDNNEEDIL